MPHAPEHIVVPPEDLDLDTDIGTDVDVDPGLDLDLGPLGLGDDLVIATLGLVGLTTGGGDPVMQPVAGTAAPPLVTNADGTVSPPAGYEWVRSGTTPGDVVDHSIRPVTMTTPEQFAGLTGAQMAQQATTLSDFFDQLQAHKVTHELYDSAGNKVGTMADAQRLVTAYHAYNAAPNDPNTQSGVWNGIKRIWNGLGENTKDRIVAATIAIGLGGIGLAVAKAATSGPTTVNMPPPPGPSPVQAGAQGVMGTVLNTPPGGAPAPPVATPGTGAGTVVPGADAVATPAPATGAGTAFNPFAMTGNQNLEGIFRSGLAGQHILASLAAYQAAREAGTTQQMAPYEDLLRLMAMSQIPQFMTPATAGAFPATAGAATPDATIPDDVQSRIRGIDRLIALKQTPLTDEAADRARQMALTELQRQKTELLAPYAATTPPAGTGGAGGPGAGQSGAGTAFTDWLMRALDPNAPDLPRQIDPIRLEIASEVSRALRGETPSPLLDRLAREETEGERNRLFARLGAGFETSSPGIEALARMRDSQAMRAEQNRQQTFATLMPQEFARRQAEYANPLAAIQTLGAGEMDRARFATGERMTGLAERLALLGMGRTSPSALAQSLSAYVPITPLLGLDATNASNMAGYHAANQAAIANFNAQNQSDAATAAAISGLFGTAAGAFRPPTYVMWPGAPAATGTGGK